MSAAAIIARTPRRRPRSRALLRPLPRATAVEIQGLQAFGDLATAPLPCRLGHDPELAVLALSLSAPSVSNAPSSRPNETTPLLVLAGRPRGTIVARAASQVRKALADSWTYHYPD